MKYPVAERFHAPQGEGLFTGTQMAFVRMVGCSVGKGTCTACDTDFDRMLPHMGGGLYTAVELVEWAGACKDICVTGGEPLDRDLRGLLMAADTRGMLCHIETSGTVHPDWLDMHAQPRTRGKHALGLPAGNGTLSWRWIDLWVTVSPKPGYVEEMVTRVSDEVKVILGGLGDGPGWPTVEDALRWSEGGHGFVYVQPRNLTHVPDMDATRAALAVVAANPRLRLSVQLHKYLNTR